MYSYVFTISYLQPVFCSYSMCLPYVFFSSSYVFYHPSVFCMYSSHICPVFLCIPVYSAHHLSSACILVCVWPYFCMSSYVFHLPSVFLGLPTLTGLPSKNKLRYTKRNIRRSQVAGFELKCILDMHLFCRPYLLPEPDQLEACIKPMLYIPMDLNIYNVEGACFTGKVQIQWIGQILDRPHQFALHSDGKYKLHHGKWILQSLGTHYLKWDNDQKCLTTSFVPLVYMFCAQHESAGSCRMLCDALLAVAEKYFPGKRLLPGATVSDHSDRFACCLRCLCCLVYTCL